MEEFSKAVYYYREHIKIILQFCFLIVMIIGLKVGINNARRYNTKHKCPECGGRFSVHVRYDSGIRGGERTNDFTDDSRVNIHRISSVNNLEFGAESKTDETGRH